MINNVMTTRYITLLAGTSNVMMTSITTMQSFIDILKETSKAIKSHFESHMINRI